MNKIILSIVVGLLFGSSCFLAKADELSEGAAAVEIFRDGRSVDIEGIVVLCRDPKNINDAFVRTNLGFVENEKIDKAKIDAAIRNLYATGCFKNVVISTKLAESGNAMILVEVFPFHKIRKLDIVGNLKFKNTALLAEISSKSNMPADKAKLLRDANKLKSFYENKGFMDVKVTFDVSKEDSSDGYKDVVFTITEGCRYKISNIKFEGNNSFKSKEIIGIMKTQTWDLLSWITSTGRLKNEVFSADLEAIEDFYKNKGFLNVVVNQNSVRFEKKAGRLDVVIPIVEGEKFKVGNVSIVGVGDDNDEILKVMKLSTGDIFSPDKIEQCSETIRDFYGKFGYLDTNVIAKRFVSGSSATTLDVLFEVTIGSKSTINSIYVSGNTVTQSRVILRELALAPGDVCDRTRMKLAKARLENTGYFQNVSIHPETTNLTDRKNLKISLEEKNTGNVYFSGAFNALEKFTFGVTISQNNFDYKNHKNFFRGAGQHFQISTQIGKYSNEIVISFEEPWLFDRELRFGFSLFRNVSKYNSSYYDESRIGGEVYLGKRLFEQVEGKLYYRLEQVDLKNMKEAHLPRVIINEKGKRTLSKVGFLMSRDTRDHIIYPTEGSLLEFDNQIAGGPAMGQTKYYRTRFTAAKWMLLSQENEQVVLFGGKTGTVRGFGGKEVPLFEKEFLGGPDDLRGFEYRHVGPKSNDNFREPLGGKTFAFGKTEYSIKLHSIVRLVGFFDVGFLNEKHANWSVSDYNSDVGLGLRLFLLNAPLRLDFAFPLRTDSYNKKKAPYFSWSFGVSF